MTLVEYRAIWFNETEEEAAKKIVQEDIEPDQHEEWCKWHPIQNNLYDCLEDFVAGLAFYNSMLNSVYEFSCKFNDSILTYEEA